MNPDPISNIDLCKCVRHFIHLKKYTCHSYRVFECLVLNAFAINITLLTEFLIIIDFTK